jgi:DNA anti-recombination protein RmuC
VTLASAVVPPSLVGLAVLVYSVIVFLLFRSRLACHTMTLKSEAEAASLATSQLYLEPAPLHPDFHAFFSEFRGHSSQTASDVSLRLDRIAGQVASTASDASSASRAIVSLQGVLGNSRTRGVWGENQLQTVLAQVGVEFDTQVSLSDGSRPDVIVHLPDGLAVAVDAKAPLDAYRSMWEADQAGNVEARSRHAKAHADALKRHITELCNRGYQRTIPGSLPFVILFVPSIGALAEAFEVSPDLPSFARARDVILADPVSLQGFILMALHLKRLWRLPDEWDALAPHVEALHLRSEDYTSALLKARKSVGDAVSALRDASASAAAISDSRSAIAALTGSKPASLPGNWPRP